MGTHRARQVVELRPDQRAEKGHGSQKVEVVLGEAPPVLHGNALGDVADVEYLLVVLAVDRLGAARLAGHLGPGLRGFVMGHKQSPTVRFL